MKEDVDQWVHLNNVYTSLLIVKNSPVFWSLLCFFGNREVVPRAQVSCNRL